MMDKQNIICPRHEDSPRKDEVLENSVLVKATTLEEALLCNSICMKRAWMSKSVEAEQIRGCQGMK